MYIDKKSPVPVYFQLKTIILEKIKNGEYSEGNLIPSERELSEALNISRMTVRQALSQLVNEGVLYREKGKGTFVSKAKFEQRNIMSFSDLVREQGLNPSTRVLTFERKPSSQDLGTLFGTENSQSLYTVKRLRFADDIPVGIEEVFLPEKYCPHLENYDLSASLYKLLKEKFYQTISHVDSVIEASRPSKEEKELLGITEKVPVLHITNIYHTDSGLKLIYEKASYRSDEFKYSVRVYGSKDTE